MMLRSAAVGPPIRKVAPASEIPPEFGVAVVPAASTPRWQAWTVIGPPELALIASPQLPTASPFTVAGEFENANTSKLLLAQLMAIRGEPAYPGCVEQSIASPPDSIETLGKPVAGAIVWTPEPGMSNAIVCGPAPPAFASRIAWRSDPAPLSFVLVTVKVVAATKPLETTRRRGKRTRARRTRFIDPPSCRRIVPWYATPVPRRSAAGTPHLAGV